jgi:hypothetical protein
MRPSFSSNPVHYSTSFLSPGRVQYHSMVFSGMNTKSAYVKMVSRLDIGKAALCLLAL